MDTQVTLEGGGWLRAERRGMQVRLRAELKREQGQQYTLWICGRGGKLCLGTLCPDGEGLALGKTVPLARLEEAGCWPVTGGWTEGENRGSGETGRTAWRRACNPRSLCPDPALELAWREPAEWRCRRGGAGAVLLSVPFSTARPVPLTPLFCLARVEEVEGRLRLVWAFREGHPLVPDKNGEIH